MQTAAEEFKIHAKPSNSSIQVLDAQSRINPDLRKLNHRNQI